MTDDIPVLNLPDDLRSSGLKCRDCGSSKVVYRIAVPTLGFDLGSYCFKHLAARCKATGIIPMPMEFDMLDALRLEIGRDPKKSMYVMP